MKFDIIRVACLVGIPFAFVALNLAMWQAAQLDALEESHGRLITWRENGSGRWNRPEKPTSRIGNVILVATTKQRSN